MKPLRDIVPKDEWRYDTKGRMKCLGLNNTCNYRAYPAVGTCFRHGGKSLRGAASATFKTGKYSNAFSGEYLKRYESYLADPKNKENQEAIAILHVLISEDVAKLQDNVQLWAEVRRATDDLVAALSARPPAGLNDTELQIFQAETTANLSDAINRLVAATKNGGNDAEARANLRRNLDLQTKIWKRDKEVKIKTKSMVTLEEILILLARNKALIDEYVAPERRADFERAFTESMGCAQPGAERIN